MREGALLHLRANGVSAAAKQTVSAALQAPGSSDFGTMEGSTSLHALPPDLLQRVFSMLPHHEHIVHALLTCKAWCAPAVQLHICGMPSACLIRFFVRVVDRSGWKTSTWHLPVVYRASQARRRGVSAYLMCMS